MEGIERFGADGEDSPHHPRNYPKNSVAYSGTHDNDTLLGFLSSLTEEKRFAFCHGLGYDGGELDVACRTAIEALYASSADIVILPVQDLLLLGSDARFNTPGRAEGNWRFRVTEEQMCAIDKNYFCDLAKQFER